jgi:hypothetical protein
MRQLGRLVVAGGLLLVAGCTSSSGGGLSPGDPLGDKGFWSLVASAKQTGGVAVEDRADALTQLLKTRPRAELEAFEQHLARASDGLRTQAVADAEAVICRGSGTFPDFRAWVIAQGEQTYDAVRADPDALAGLADVRRACTSAGEPFRDAAVAPYADAGFDPGSEAFPLLDDDEPPTGAHARDLSRLRKRFG